jgi:predicted transcriptional regulator
MKMSYEDTPTQVTSPAVDAPAKRKAGRPPGAKNKKPAAKKTTSDASLNKLAASLRYAELHIKNIEEEYKKLRQRYTNDVNKLHSIIDYLEANLRDAWQKEAVDNASSV